MHCMARRWLPLAATGLALFASACGEVHTERPLQLEPGVYKGQKDEPLSEDMRKALAERAAQQR